MKLAIISDIHDNLANLDKALKVITDERIDILISCGDLTSLETLNYLVSAFNKPIYLVHGNGCFYTKTDTLMYPNITDLGRHGGVITLDNLKIGICHEPSFIENLSLQNPHIIFYGHTHKPWEELSARGIRLVNPGNISNTRFGPTFALYDTKTDNLQLILLDELN